MISNTFLLTKEGPGYVVVEEVSYIPLIKACGLASALYALWQFLLPLEQSDLNNLLLSKRRYDNTL